MKLQLDGTHLKIHLTASEIAFIQASEATEFVAKLDGIGDEIEEFLAQSE